MLADILGCTKWIAVRAIKVLHELQAFSSTPKDDLFFGT
jgi:hypothetical protein